MGARSFKTRVASSSLRSQHDPEGAALAGILVPVALLLYVGIGISMYNHSQATPEEKAQASAEKACHATHYGRGWADPDTTPKERLIAYKDCVTQIMEDSE